ncbi:hypothetical protein MBLNU457_5793t2 [Dothideomycetes sp. NU457]
MASSSNFGGAERRTYGNSSSSFGGDRPGGSSYAHRGFAERPRYNTDLPLPDKPPYTAHLGNLSFEVTEGDVQSFLAECNVTSVRLVEDKIDHRPKGFGYVEFGTVDGLKKALTLSETQFQGRNIRISIAEPPKERSEAREISDWSRKGPLPDLPGQGGSMRRPSDRGGMGRSFDAGPDAGGERGPRKGFFEGDDKVRDFSSWERKGPLAPPPGAAPRQGGREPRGPPEERRASPAWGEGRSDGSRPPRPDRPERPERPERAPTAADMDNQWRSKMRPDAPSPAATPEASMPSSPQAPSAPASRPRLNLAKRTVSEAPAAEESKSNSSIFGGAKPVDTSAREAAAEEKQREAARARKEAEEKAREDKKAREAARAERIAAEKSNNNSNSNSEAATPRENGTSSNSNSKQRPTGERKASSNDAVPGNKQQYEILRRMNDDGEGEGEDGAPPADRDGPDASANGEIITDKETLPQETVREVVRDNNNKGGNNWRQPQQQSEPSSQALEDDGFTVVSSHQKKKGRGGGRALAS